MKRAVLCLFFLLLMAFSVSADETVKLINKNDFIVKKHISIRGLGENTGIVAEAYPWEANSLVTLMGNGEVLIIDTLYTPEAMKELLDYIRDTIGERKITAVNTHFHIDRLGGNKALAEKNIEIFGSKLTLKMIHEKGKESINQLLKMIADTETKKYYENFEYVEPTNIFDENEDKVLAFGNENVIINYPGTGHTADNLIVYIPAKKIIFGGCFIFEKNKNNIGNITDGSLAEWRKNIKNISADGYDTVIPGHGKAGGIELIEHTRNILGK